MSHPDLLVGTSTSDDAAVYRLSEDLAIVMTVDFFPPIVDDPFTFGEIAAANSLSDVYAMGAKPIAALNIVGFPSDLDMSILGEIMKGGASKALEAGIVIVGGHTVADAEPKYGLSVTGLVRPGEQVTNAGAQPKDILIITKPIGTGIITTAGKQGIAPESVLSEAVSVMATLNRNAAESMIEIGVNACSDVTGFGLLGHLREMVEGAKVSAHLNLSNIPIIPGTLELLSKGIAPGGTRRNLDSIMKVTTWDTEISDSDKLLLSDAQTSGGLLISVDQTKVNDLLGKLTANGVNDARVIGEIVQSEGQSRIFVHP